MINFNKNFKHLKEQNKLEPLTIEKETGISRVTLKNYEFYSDLPNYENIKKLSNFFQVTIDFLLLNSKNSFINNYNLFFLAEKTNNLPSMQRNHIEDTVAQFINIKSKVKTKFDDKKTYQFEPSINKNIKIIRDFHKVSQSALAKTLNLKSGNSISNIERGAAKVPYDLLYILSKKYSVSIHYLITGMPLVFEIKESFLLESLIKFDKTAKPQDIQTVTNLMQRIFENNNIDIEK